MGLKPAIFLDRDGVLNVNRSDYVKNETEIELFPWTTAAMCLLASLDVYIFVFTNQSAIGRGLINPRMAENINDHLTNLIEANGGRIDAIYTCPHLPETGCECRKPDPGMIFHALHDYPDMDMDDITLVGDQLTDMMNIPGSKPMKYLVQSGLTTKSSYLLGKTNNFGFLPSLLEVAQHISKWHAVQRSNTTANLVNST